MKDEKAILESYGTITEDSDSWYLSNDYGGAVDSAYWSNMSYDDPPIYGMLGSVGTVMWYEVRRIDANR